MKIGESAHFLLFLFNKFIRKKKIFAFLDDYNLIEYNTKNLINITKKLSIKQRYNDQSLNKMFHKNQFKVIPLR